MTSIVLLSNSKAESLRKRCNEILGKSVYELTIVQNINPQPTSYKAPLSSPGLTDNWLRLARRTRVFDDFKRISDLAPKKLSLKQKQEILRRGKYLRQKMYGENLSKGDDPKAAAIAAIEDYVRFVVTEFYKEDSGLKRVSSKIAKAHWRLKPMNRTMSMNEDDLISALDYVENHWTELIRISPESSEGSLLPAPYPVLLAGGRFNEAYYWDSYFGSLGLLATGRWDIVAAQAENFLHMIQTFGKVPNGFRDYYLTRSQPPVVSQLVRLVYDNALADTGKNNNEITEKWLKERALPLLKADYENFWMKQRYNPETGLNFYSDDLNVERPERHSNEDDSKLAKTYRDVRGEAESGLDHTDLHMGEASQVASVMLNSFLYQYEQDLAHFSEIAGDHKAAMKHKKAAKKRLAAINKYLWDPHSGVYRSYNFATKQQSHVVGGETFAPLFFGLSSPEQARLVKERSKVWLEFPGGMAASNAYTGKNWDGHRGWAPFQFMAIRGFDRYGFTKAARRLATKWVAANAKIFKETGLFYENIDVLHVAPPIDEPGKYPTQTGFLWTNASFVWALKYLGYRFVPIALSEKYGQVYPLRIFNSKTKKVEKVFMVKDKAGRKRFYSGSLKPVKIDFSQTTVLSGDEPGWTGDSADKDLSRALLKPVKGVRNVTAKTLETLAKKFTGEFKLDQDGWQKQIADFKLADLLVRPGHVVLRSKDSVEYFRNIFRKGDYGDFEKSIKLNLLTDGRGKMKSMESWDGHHRLAAYFSLGFTKIGDLPPGTFQIFVDGRNDKGELQENRPHVSGVNITHLAQAEPAANTSVPGTMSFPGNTSNFDLGSRNTFGLAYERTMAQDQGKIALYIGEFNPVDDQTLARIEDKARKEGFQQVVLVLEENSVNGSLLRPAATRLNSLIDKVKGNPMFNVYLGDLSLLVSQFGNEAIVKRVMQLYGTSRVELIK